MENQLPDFTNQQIKQSTSFSPQVNPTPSKKLWLKFIVSIVVILIIGVGGLIAYNRFLVSPETPEYIVSKAFLNYQQFKTIEYNLTTETEVIPGEETIKANEKAMEIIIKQNPALAKTIQESSNDLTQNLKSIVVSTIKANLENPNDLQTETTNKTESSLAGSNSTTKTISAGGKNYITLLNGKEHSVFNLYASKNVWVMLGGDKTSNELTDFFSKTSGKAGTVRQDFFDGKFFKVITKSGDEKINGIDTYHFIITLDDISLKNAYEELIGSLLGGNTDNAVSQVAKQISFSDLNVWVSKNDKIIRKGSMTIITGDPKIMSNKAVYTFELKDFNKPVNIEIPSSWITFEEASKLK